MAMGMPMSYKATCRSVAYGICKGEVGAAVEANGCSITTSQTLNLQRKCENQVDSMTSESDDTVIVIPTQPVSSSRCSRKGSCLVVSPEAGVLGLKAMEYLQGASIAVISPTIPILHSGFAVMASTILLMLLARMTQKPNNS